MAAGSRSNQACADCVDLSAVENASAALVRVVQGVFDLRPGEPDIAQFPVAESEQRFSRGLPLLTGDPGRQPVVDAIAEIGCELPAYGNRGGRIGDVGNHGHGLSSCVGLAGARMMTTWPFHRKKTFRKL